MIVLVGNQMFCTFLEQVSQSPLQYKTKAGDIKLNTDRSEEIKLVLNCLLKVSSVFTDLKSNKTELQSDHRNPELDPEFKWKPRT